MWVRGLRALLLCRVYAADCIVSIVVVGFGMGTGERKHTACPVGTVRGVPGWNSPCLGVATESTFLSVSLTLVMMFQM